MKIVGAIAGIVGGIIIIIAGINMTHIISQSGDTIMEAYYHAMGKGFIGLGIFCIALVCIMAFGEVSLTEEREDEEEDEEEEEEMK